MLIRVPHVKGDRSFGIEALDVFRPNVGFDRKGETVDPRGQRGTRRQELPRAAVLVRQGATDLLPAALALSFQEHGYAARRPAARDVQDVRGDAAHDDKRFSSRRLVRRRIYPAAMRSTVTGRL